MPPPLRSMAPAELLSELGIDEPEDIDVEAIAEYCKATIVYAPLTGCEARIIGHGDRAIITINEGSSPERKRFSAGHELGHWSHDRGRATLACTERQFTSEWFTENPEQRANRYAADLLMPVHMFQLRAANKPVTFSTVGDLAGTFQTSVTATAIRVVECGAFPSMVICSDGRGRKWFTRSEILPETLWPHNAPGTETAAFELHRNPTASPQGPIVIDAVQWINHPNAGRYVVTEDSIRINSSLVLTLLWWKDERQLLDLVDEQEEEDQAERDPFDFD